MSVNTIDVRFGDCLEVLRAMPDCSVDAVVTDPPYGLADHRPAAIVAALTAWANGDRERVPDGRGFMGRAWDAFVPPPAVWDECLRVLRPGGHLAAFAGSRTYDLMGLAIRMAGFEIRDGLQWIYGSGMPKSLDVSKAIDATLLHGGANSRRIREANDSREVLGPKTYANGEHVAANLHRGRGARNNGMMGEAVPAHAPAQNVTAPTTDEAARWSGWGTALKPAHEPMVLARKPLDGTVAANVLAHGTGGLNIDATRVGTQTRTNPAGGASSLQRVSRVEQGYRDHVTTSVGQPSTVTGRWPANVVLDEEAAATLDEQSGTLTSGKMRPTHTTAGRAVYGQNAAGGYTTMETYGDSGGASRFFYCAKASAKERPKVDGQGWPTVKPLALMRWLVRLVTPPGGTVLDPFAGTGTTLQAADLEGFDAIGIERDELAYRLICQRLGREDPGAGFAADLVPVAEPELVVVEGSGAAPLGRLEATAVDPVVVAIEAAQSPAELAEIIRSTDPARWTPAHTAAAQARITALGEVAA